MTDEAKTMTNEEAEEQAVKAALDAFRQARKDGRTEINQIRAAVVAYERGLWNDIAVAPRNHAVLAEQEGDMSIVTWMTAIETGEGDWIVYRQVGENPIAVRLPAPRRWRPVRLPHDD